MSLMPPESTPPQPPFAPIEAAIEQFRRGRTVIIVDDEDHVTDSELEIAYEIAT